MKNGYDGRKLLEALGVLEEEIGRIEEKIRPTLREKQEKDKDRQKLQEVERELNEEKRLVKQAAAIDRLLSYAGESEQLSGLHMEQVTKWESRRNRLKQAVEAYGNREQAYTEAAAADKCLQLYRRLCNQMEASGGVVGNVQMELNNLQADKYLSRKDALGIGLRLLGLSNGLEAARCLNDIGGAAVHLVHNITQNRQELICLNDVDGTAVRLIAYIKTTADMLDNYMKSCKLERQGKTRLNNVLATLLIWLILLEDRAAAGNSFNRLVSLQINWVQEECPAECFAQFYELVRQNKATPMAIRLLGYQLVRRYCNDSEIYAVKAYLEGIKNGSESVEQILTAQAKNLIHDYLQSPYRDSRLRETISALEGFRGRPFFKEAEETISAEVNAYYDDKNFRAEIERGYREYLDTWMRDSSLKKKNYIVVDETRAELREEFPLDALEREINSCKNNWVILKPDAFLDRMNLVSDEKEQLKTLEYIAKKGRYDRKAKERLKNRKHTVKKVKYGKDDEETLPLIWMLAAVLVPLNFIPMVLFEIVLNCRTFWAQDKGEEKKQWIGKENRRLNLIAAASMALFYFTGGYGVGEYTDTIVWLHELLMSSDIDGLGGATIIMIAYPGGIVLISYFAWTTFRGLLELLGGILKRS